MRRSKSQGRISADERLEVGGIEVRILLAGLHDSLVEAHHEAARNKGTRALLDLLHRIQVRGGDPLGIGFSPAIMQGEAIVIVERGITGCHRTHGIVQVLGLPGANQLFSLGRFQRP
jgi:hypothetical protein